MNYLTQIRNRQKDSRRERNLNLTGEASWHSQFKNSAYIRVDGLNYRLTEGDLLAVFEQYGEVVDVNLIRHEKTGESRGFAFLAYRDQRSTILAVDNLDGVSVGNRIIHVIHAANYKRKRLANNNDDAGDETGERNTFKMQRKEDIDDSKRKTPGEGTSSTSVGLLEEMNAHLKKKQKELPRDDPKSEKSNSTARRCSEGQRR